MSDTSVLCDSLWYMHLFKSTKDQIELHKDCMSKEDAVCDCLLVLSPGLCERFTLLPAFLACA